MKEIILSALIAIGAGTVGLVSRFVMKKKPDNPIEQLAEAVIKETTGVDIDLSPDVDGNALQNNETVDKSDKSQ